MMNLTLSTIGNQAWNQLIREQHNNLFSETTPQLCTLCHDSPKPQRLEQPKKAAPVFTEIHGEPARHNKHRGLKSERPCDLFVARRTCPGHNNATCFWGHDQTKAAAVRGQPELMEAVQSRSKSKEVSHRARKADAHATDCCVVPSLPSWVEVLLRGDGVATRPTQGSIPTNSIDWCDGFMPLYPCTSCNEAWIRGGDGMPNQMVGPLST